jgi:MinD-like ATPase involved in chromosome partitioning or flagellar assembly
MSDEMHAPDLVVPIDVAVVDPDLLWRVELMNAMPGLMVKDVITVYAAMEHLTPGHPAVVLLGPDANVESADQLPQLREDFPNVRVVVATGPLLDPAVEPIPPPPALTLVPDPADPSVAPTDPERQTAATVEAAAAEEAADEDAGVLVNRILSPGASRTEVVDAVREELAKARVQAQRIDTGTSYRTLSDTQVIVVTSAKGGDGATTVAANLATAFAARGRSVGLVEGDPTFGDLSLVLALPVPQAGIATHPDTGVRLLAPSRPARIFDPIDVDRLLDQISTVEPPFDVVVIEAPASIVHRSGLGRMADKLLVVCSGHLGSIKNAVVLIDALGHDNLGVVVNRLGRHGPPSHQLEEALRAHVVATLPVTPELTPSRPDEAPSLAPRRSAFAKEMDRLAGALEGARTPA